MVLIPQVIAGVIGGTECKSWLLKNVWLKLVDIITYLCKEGVCVLATCNGLAFNNVPYVVFFFTVVNIPKSEAKATRLPPRGCLQWKS